MLSEHPITNMLAAFVGGQAWTADGYENTGVFARPKYDYVIMPSGYAISTDAAYSMFMLGGVPALLTALAYGEEWAMTHDLKSYDPRTNKDDELADGGTGKPSPTLLPYYAHPEKFGGAPNPAFGPGAYL